MITDVRGIRVGHRTHLEAATGCTVVLPPPGTIGSGEVRGGAPGTRETDLLRPGMLVEEIDAVLLTGGRGRGDAVARRTRRRVRRGCGPRADRAGGRAVRPRRRRRERAADGRRR